MPHKHKRQRTDKTDTYDLPPTSSAAPLPVKNASKAPGLAASEKRKAKAAANANAKKKRNDADDTPKAFARLMARYQGAAGTGKKLGSGEDTGERRKKVKEEKVKVKEAADRRNGVNGGGAAGKRKRGGDAEEDLVKAGKTKGAQVKAAAESDSDAGADSDDDDARYIRATSPSAQQNQLRIRPGERLGEFAARVDASLPLTGLTSKISKARAAELGIRERKTKHNKRLQKMIKEWRTEDEKIRNAELEREEEEEVERAVEEDEETKQARLLWEGVQREKAGRKGKKNKASSGNAAVDEGDIWASVGRKSVLQTEKKTFNSNDVVLAPPVLAAVREKFKVRNGAVVDVGSVPSASGSLRKRELLESERKNVVESYRRAMAEKRAGGAGRA